MKTDEERMIARQVLRGDFRFRGAPSSALEYDNGDEPVGVALIRCVGGVHFHEPWPEPLALLLTRLPGSHPAALAADVAASPFYELLPFDYPGPLIRVCRTEYGICLIPFTLCSSWDC